MIFFNPKCEHKFLDYGIEIPIKGNRAQRVFDELKKTRPDLSYTNLENSYFFTKSDLLLAHNKNFIENLFESEETLKKEIFKSYELYNEKTGEFHRYNPNNQIESFLHLRDVILSQASMTYNSAKSSLQNGFSFHLGGGMHHAMSFGGRGFCLVHDIIISIRKLQNEGLIKTAWIIDVDAHKGDGAPEILKNDESIKTFSIHMKNGWPLNDGDKHIAPWFIPSDIDVEIDINEESLYLEKLKDGLERFEKISRPDLCIVVNGADPYEHDELQSASLIKLNKDQMLQRDLMVYNFLKKNNIPQSYVMAGGYGDRSWEVWYQFLNHVL